MTSGGTGMKLSKRVLALVLSAAFVVGTFAGCGNTQQQGSSAAGSSAAGGKITVKDLTGKEFTFDKPLDKVAIQWSGSGGPFMIMAALYGKDFVNHIAAMDDGLVKNRKDMYDQYVKDVPEIANINIIGSVENDGFNLEKLISSGAEAFVVPLGIQATLKEGLQEKIEKAGIPVIYMDYHAETMENHIASTKLLGKLFGKEDRAKEIVDWYKSHMDPLNEKIKTVVEKNGRPKVYIECAQKGRDEIGNSYGNNYMWGAMVYNVGGTSIADGKVTKYSPLEKEFILSTDPDVIIFTGSIWEGQTDYARMGFAATKEDSNERLKKILTRDGWDNLKAVKNNRVYSIHHGLGREIYDCASFEALAKFIWPEDFKDLDPEATLKGYYEKFLPFTYGGLWFLHYGE
jgi:iron complex transport system substrate-binding protein